MTASYEKALGKSSLKSEISWRSLRKVRYLVVIASSDRLAWHFCCYLRELAHSASARKISSGGALPTPRLAINPTATVNPLTAAAATKSGRIEGA